MAIFNQTALNRLQNLTAGLKNVVVTAITASASGEQINWNTYANDSTRFTPQSLFADNTLGIAPLVIVSQTTGFTMTIPAGGFIALPFPATDNDYFRVTGSGNVVIYWVDYPVRPWSYVGTGGGGGGGDASAANQLLQLYPGKLTTASEVTSIDARLTPPESSSDSTVSASASSVTLLAGNVNRKGAVIWNDSTSAILYVRPRRRRRNYYRLYCRP